MELVVLERQGEPSRPAASRQAGLILDHLGDAHAGAATPLSLSYGSYHTKHSSRTGLLMYLTRCYIYSLV